MDDIPLNGGIGFLLLTLVGIAIQDSGGSRSAKHGLVKISLARLAMVGDRPRQHRSYDASGNPLRWWRGANRLFVQCAAERDGSVRITSTSRGAMTARARMPAIAAVPVSRVRPAMEVIAGMSRKCRTDSKSSSTRMAGETDFICVSNPITLSRVAPDFESLLASGAHRHPGNNPSTLGGTAA